VDVTTAREHERRGEDVMELLLSDDDARMLRGVLSEHLQDMRREVAGTEAKDYRHELVLRQEVVERVLAQLDRKGKA
jgi:hypothetical protein